MTPDTQNSVDSLLPAEMAARAERIGVEKTRLDTASLIALAVLAGAFVAFGSIFSIVVTAGAEGVVPYGVTRLLGGIVFSLGLILVIVGGAELFTGNNLMVMACASGTLLGRLQAVREGVLHFADDLGQSLEYGDAAYDEFLNKVDRFVEQNGMSLSAEPEARARHRDPPCVAEPLRQIDNGVIGLSSVIWATGYKFDFSWIDLPVLDPYGRPKHNHGIAPVRGIYFIGLPWLSEDEFLLPVGCRR